MKFLMFYGTAEGHTFKIAQTISERIQAAGHDAKLKDASQRVSDIDLDNLDAFLAAAPVHQQRHPDAVIDYIKLHSERLNALPSALISVSLSAAFTDGHAEAQSYADRLLDRTGWRPTALHLAAGALRYDKYDFFQEQIIRHIVLKGRDVDELSGEHEFTDWAALKAFADAFVGHCAQ